MAPNSVPVPVNGKALEQPASMSYEDIEEWKSSFLSAVKRSARAGFDVIEFHAAHGYGLNQWLSPNTNRRTDRYGGSLENRSRLLLEIVSEAIQAEPQIVFAVRMPGQDFIEGGIARSESRLLGQWLEKLGVGILDISSGIGGWRRPRDRSGEGYLASEARLIQKAVTIPVIAVGGIQSGAYIDQGIADGDFSLAAVGRAILKDPVDWRRKQFECV